MKWCVVTTNKKNITQKKEMTSQAKQKKKRKRRSIGFKEECSILFSVNVWCVFCLFHKKQSKHL